MADAEAEGHGAYPSPLNGNAAVVAVAVFAPLVPPASRFDVAIALLGPEPTKTNTSFALHPSLENY